MRIAEASRTARCLKAEWLKLLRRPLERRLAVLLLMGSVCHAGGLLVFLFPITAGSNVSAVRQLESMTTLWMGVGFLLAPVLGAANIGHEYSFGTLALAFAGGNRWLTFSAKAVVNICYGLMLIAGTTLAAVGTVSVMAGDVVEPARHLRMWMALGGLTSATLAFMFFGTLSMLAASIFRSIQAGALVGFVAQFLPSHTFGAAASYTPWYLITQSGFLITAGSPDLAWRVEAIQSIVITLLYVVGVVAVGSAVLRWQEPSKSAA